MAGKAKRPTFLRYVLSGSAATMITRITGYFRELAMVYFIGPGRFADIFYLVYRIPNLIRRLLGEGALTSALIPVFKAVEREDGTEAARKFASRVVSLQVIITTVFSILVILASLGIWLFSDSSSEIRIYAELTAAVIPYAIFICAAALFSALLNTKGVYFLPPLMQAIINVVWIGGTIAAGMALGARLGLAVLGVGIVLACAFSAWLLWYILAAKGIRIDISWRISEKIPAMKGFMKKFGITLIGVASYPINILADSLMAQFVVQKEGAVTCLYQGDRLMQVPLGVLSVSIGAVALAELSKHAEDKRRFYACFSRALSLALFISIPVAAFLCCASTQIVDLALNYGEFARMENISALNRTSLALFCYSLGLPAYFAIATLTRTFYSLQDMVTPVRINWWMVTSNIILNVILLWLTPLNEAALALSSAVVAYINVGLLYGVIYNKFTWLNVFTGVKNIPKVVLATTISILLTLWTIWLFGGEEAGIVFARFERFAIPALVFFASFFLSAKLLRIREIHELKRIRRKKR